MKKKCFISYVHIGFFFIMLLLLGNLCLLYRNVEFMTDQSRKYFWTSLVLIISGGFVVGMGELWIHKNGIRREISFLIDSLTGGFNREGFLKEATFIVEKRGFSSCAIICLNISGFRNINELCGEDAGNNLLRFVFHSISDSLGTGELVCRNSMDHFILLVNEKSEKDISERTQLLIEKMNKVIREKSFGYNLDFFVGVCQLSIINCVAAAISNAMNVSKQCREKNICIFYNEDTKKRIATEAELDEQFEDAIRNQNFEVYLQPKVGNAEENVCQAEALVRWHHPEKGIIYPNQFIPLYEKSEKIEILDLYMFEKVCQLLKGWIENKQEVTVISINVSRNHLKNAGADVWKKYRDIKERYQIPDGMIEIELTETTLIDGNQLVVIKQVLDGFRSCGLKVALDDFGFAYSSLSLLKDFEVDTLKLDRTFFVNENGKSRKIVENIIRLAHSLNMRVVAEGIEQMEQVEILQEMDCDLIQGYIYSKPLPVGEFEMWRENYKE